MLTRCYSLFDKKAAAYGQPFFMRADGEARRSVMTEVMNPDSMLNKFPEDYALYFVGVWNDASGTFDQAEKPVFLDECVALKVHAQERAS